VRYGENDYCLNSRDEEDSERKAVNNGATNGPVKHYREVDRILKSVASFTQESPAPHLSPRKVVAGILFVIFESSFELRDLSISQRK
jgi:hypothetical protein